MDEDPNVTQWVAALKDGDADAADKLWPHFFRRMTGLARQQLRASLRKVADEEDVALSAFRTLCRGAEEGRFEKLTTREDLWQLLAKITVRKALNQNRWQAAQKRGGGEVRGESIFQEHGDDAAGAPEPGFDLFENEEPTPVLLYEMLEEQERLMEVLGEEDLREIARLKFEGFSNSEIAQKTGRAQRSVERKLVRIREAWSDALAQL